MLTADPTILRGDAALPPDVEFSVEDVETASDGGRPAREETAAEVPQQVRIGRVHEIDPASLAEAGTRVQPSRVPFEPVPITRRVSGRYRHGGAVQLELRIDIDGRYPLRCLSGDFFTTAGATLNYFGSFIVRTPRITSTRLATVIDGIGSFTWSAAFPRVRVTIPKSSIFGPAAAATVRFLTVTGSAGASYACGWESPWFRTVQLEEDHVTGVTPFASYDTGSLPAPPPARALSVAAAYGEAGIEIQVAGTRNVVATAGIGSAWSNAELHDAMLTNFSLWQNLPQWKVWLLTAQLHDLGPGLLGIMFDQQGRQRQGCAVFHANLAGSTPDRQRDQLYTCVHELGHCFNLYHSFHKQYMNPPQPNRLDALSWMNYPWGFPGGAAAFWSQFSFQFDAPELVHLRHAFRNDIVIGGNPFGTGAALEDPGAFADPIEDHSGLRLELRGRTSYLLGEPVVPEIKLELTDLRGREITANLHPNFGFVEIGIQHPSGRVRVYRPMLQHCITPTTGTLTADTPSIYESAYIGYGLDGLYFDSPGLYRLRAAYIAPDGSRVISNSFSLRVRSPVTREDDDVAELVLGEEQGSLFYLLGSDSQHLTSGRDALHEVIDRHGKHPLAVYARLTHGMNALREFKHIAPRSHQIVARQPDLEEGTRMLSVAVEASMAGKGLDNISLNQAMRTLADAQEATGDTAAAQATAQRMLEHFRKLKLKPHVLELIGEQVSAYEPGEDYLNAAQRRARANLLDPSMRRA